MIRFIGWFFYQLYHANFEFLVFVAKEAFEAVQNIQLLVIQSGAKAHEFLMTSSTRIVQRVAMVSAAMDKSEARNELAQRVLDDDQMLRISTPETKGMLIYQLTRHGKADWTDTDNYELGDAFALRKRAVLRILQYVQTRREWSNVFQHMSPTGVKIEGSHYLTVKRFLCLGYDNMDDDLVSIESRLKSGPSRGKPIVPNNTMAYQLQPTDNKDFTMASIESLSSLELNRLA